MNVRTWHLPFRVGATSYIVADDLLPNAEFLAAHVQDMQLVLFDLPDGQCNVPSPALVAELAAMGRAHDLGYTVHLLHDLRLGDSEDPRHASLQSAYDIMQRTRPLEPWAWVGHLDGRDVRAADTSMEQLAWWRHQAHRALQVACDWMDTPAQLAIENLEGYPADFVTPVVMRSSVSRCVDVGHLWLDGHDPIAHLRAAWPRLRVVHLHGTNERDHASLAHVPPEQLDRVVHLLLARRFTGVVTLEIFGEEDFWSSLAALSASVYRFKGE